MKICWDNLEKLRYRKDRSQWQDIKYKGIFYFEMDKCQTCGESYLSCSYNSLFCNPSCRKATEKTKKMMSKSHIGKYLSEKTKKKISKKNIGKIISFEVRNKMRKSSIGDKCNFWKGGVTKKNIPLYDTYAPQIEYAEEVRRNKDDENILEVKCAYCGKWYIPTINNVRNRIKVLNGKKEGDSNFYCSISCKKQCPVFYKQIYQIGHPKLDNIERPYQNEWSKMVCERENYICEICGKYGNIAHHELPVKTHPHLQADIDNGICLCEDCHMKHGHKDECSTGKLANKIC